MARCLAFVSFFLLESLFTCLPLLSLKALAELNQASAQIFNPSGGFPINVRINLQWNHWLNSVPSISFCRNDKLVSATHRWHSFVFVAPVMTVDVTHLCDALFYGGVFPGTT